MFLAVFALLFGHSEALVAQNRESKRPTEWPAVYVKSMRLVPAFPRPNQVSEIQITVANESDWPANAFKALVSSETEVLGTPTLSLKPQEETTIKVRWNAGAAGDYWLRCILDVDADLREKDRSDNVMEIKVSVSEKPELDSLKKSALKPVFSPLDFPGGQEVKARQVAAAGSTENQWESLGPDFISDIEGYPWPLAGGRLSAIAIHPDNPDIMYVGAQSSGVWKTTNGGQSWFSLTDRISMSVAALTLAPDNPSRVYWATYGEGVYRSNNGGSNWTQISNQALQAVVHGGKMIVLPNDPAVMFVKSKIGLYRSGDGGVTWILVGPSARCSGVEVANFNSNYLYATFSHDTNNNNAGLFMSYDKGLTWTKKLGCPGAALPAAVSGYNITLAQSKNTLFLGFKSSSEFKLYYTTNLACNVGGDQDNEWKKGWSTTVNHAELWSGLWANPYDEKRLYLGGTAFWVSTNGGNTFTKVSDYNTSNPSAHADHHGFAVKPGNKDIIFTLNDGGIYRSESNGSNGSWKFIGKGISNVEFYDFAAAFGSPDLMIGGTQDNGTIKTNGSTEWDAIRGGDGATVDIDDSDPNIMYSMGQYAPSIARSTNGGGGWTAMANQLPTGNECFNFKWHLHPKKSNILLASCTGLWRIDNPNGGSWQTIFTPPEGKISCSAVVPATDLYLAGTTSGKIFGGVGGANFQLLFTRFAPVTDIECDLEVPGDIYVAYDGNNQGRVYRLRKNGNTFTGTDITTDLPPNFQVQCIAIDRMNPYTIFAGTNKGVYRGRSTDQGQTWHWAEFMEGMPVADVRDMEVHPATGAVRACTFGRGIFEVFTGPPVGSVLAKEGKVSFLRAHDPGTGYGPPGDALDAELIVKLDSSPDDYFGAQLRTDTNAAAHLGMMDSLRKAFKLNLPVRIEYIRNGIHSGKIVRVILL